MILYSAVADASRCVFSYGVRNLYTQLRILSTTQMSCGAPKFCDWVSNGTVGRTNGSLVRIPPPGTPCIFPFYYRGQVYTQCQQPSLLPGFLDNLSPAELSALNSSTICSMTANLTADRSWATCSCKALNAMKATFAFTFNIYFLRYAPTAFKYFAFYYDMTLFDLYPKAGTTQGGTR